MLKLIWLFVIVVCVTTVTVRAKATSAAIPRSKSKGNMFNKMLGSGFAHRIIREMKINFCSELEALTLQVRC